MPTPEQLRAARALSGLSQSEVGHRAGGLSSMTVKRAEGSGKPYPSKSAVEAIEQVFIKAGIEFIHENGGGAGVRFRERSK